MDDIAAVNVIWLSAYLIQDLTGFNRIFYRYSSPGSTNNPESISYNNAAYRPPYIVVENLAQRCIVFQESLYLYLNTCKSVSFSISYIR